MLDPVENGTDRSVAKDRIPARAGTRAGAKVLDACLERPHKPTRPLTHPTKNNVYALISDRRSSGKGSLQWIERRRVLSENIRGGNHRE
jgi:hypothetical protein